MARVKKIEFSSDGEALMTTVHGLRRLRGRFATVGKRRDCLITRATRDGVTISISHPSPRGIEIKQFALNDPSWDLTYVQGVPSAPQPSVANLHGAGSLANSVTRCTQLRLGLSLDGSQKTLRCVNRLGHAGAHHYRNNQQTKHSESK
jgi:hypothetical protein